MKTTIALQKITVQAGLRVYQNTLKRKQAKETNPGILALLDKDIAELETAINTMSEAK